MDRPSYPILEHDPDPQAILNPRAVKTSAPVPPRAVICYFREVLDALAARGRLEEIAALKSEMGPIPLYRLETEGSSLIVFQGLVGGPLMAAGLEELIVLGCSRFIVVGGAGVLDSRIPRGHIILPLAALRDEGTSYHYLPPGRVVEPRPEAVAAIRATLDAHSVAYDEGPTWTTDAIYRETRHKIIRRRAEGCLTVEMEAASLFAVARFRGVILGQMLYGGDDVGGEEWDMRDWIEGAASVREKLFWLAVDAVGRIEGGGPP